MSFPDPGTGARGSWRLGLVMALAACLPVLVASAPQMADYPAHLAAFRVMLAHGGDPFLAQYYRFEWHLSGNLGADLLIWPLAAIFGLETGGRVIAGLIPLLTGLGILTVARTVQGRIAPGTLMAFAFIWSPSLLLGFLNFSLALALALFAFALWVRMEENRWRRAVFIPAGLLVWLCHVAGWGVLGILVFGYEWHRHKHWLTFAAPWPLFFPLLPMLAGSGSNDQFSYGSSLAVYKTGIFLRAMRAHDMPLDVMSLAIVVAVLAVALLRRRIDGRLGWAALLLVLLALAMPRHIFGGDYADYRLVPVALMVGCMAIDWPVARWGAALAVLLFAVRLAVTTQVWHADSRTTNEMLTSLDELPRGARMATAVPMRRDRWGIGSFDHLGSYAVVRRSALENSSFALPDIHMLQVRGLGASFADPSHRIFYSRGEVIDLAKFGPARQADYLWYVGTARPVRLPPGARIIHRTPHSFLARLANPPRGR